MKCGVWNEKKNEDVKLKSNETVFIMYKDQILRLIEENEFIWSRIFD